MSRYADRGVSHGKEDVHSALKEVDKGLFPGAFCKIVPDLMTGSDEHCIVMHADGAGTKSSLAYMYWRETGDCSVFKGIAQDSIVMNTDDAMCVGVTDETMLMSSTIGRNAKTVPGEVVAALIQGNESLCMEFKQMGIRIEMTGGETADVGDVVRTLIVDSTIAVRMKRSDVICNDTMGPGDLIIGLSSTGRAIYEDRENSGIASNGLTMARHELLKHEYIDKYPEASNAEVDRSLRFQGNYSLSDPLEGSDMTIGEALLSPTRTYLPVIRQLLAKHRRLVKGIVHCSGGGQTKCSKFGKRLRYIKDNLFPCPPIFKAIQEASGATWREMFQVFNMGHRLELYGNQELYQHLLEISQAFRLECRIIGKIERASQEKNEVVVVSEFGKFEYIDQC